MNFIQITANNFNEIFAFVFYFLLTVLHSLLLPLYLSIFPLSLTFHFHFEIFLKLLPPKLNFPSAPPLPSTLFFRGFPHCTSASYSLLLPFVKCVY